MAATTLPNFFVLPFTDTSAYLRPVEAAANEPPHVLKFASINRSDPLLKFAKEQSQTPGLVHIRSCYNNKYWVPVHQADRPAGQQYRIAASADEPEEDVTSPACTLFRLSPGFQLQSIRWPGYVGIDENRTLILKSTTTTFSTVFDWEKLVILPARVTFRSEHLGGNYLKAYIYRINGHQFKSGLEFDDPLVGYELFPQFLGNYRIKSLYYGKMLRKDDSNWIRGDGELHNQDTYFDCVRINDNVVALRNVANGLFCGPHSTSERDEIDVFSARYTSITRETRLIVEEWVLRREVSVREYYLPRSRVFGGQVLALAEQTIQNGSPVRDLEQVITFSETVETTTSWNNSVSVNVGVSTEFSISAIPFVASGKVTLSLDVGYEHQWGGSKTTSTTLETSTKVVVPPLTNMKVSLLCTKATCDVPFSYNVTDLLPSGGTVSTVKDDGLFTGVNAYEFRIRSVEVDENGQELKLLNVEPVEPSMKSQEKLTIN